MRQQASLASPRAPAGSPQAAPRVLFDHQVFELQPWGGIAHYFHRLLAGLIGSVEVELALARSRNEHVPSLNRLLGLAVTDRGFRETFLGGRKFRGSKQLFSLAKLLDPALDARRANRRTSLSLLRAGGYDLFHPTYYDPYFLGALGSPFVLTVHDLTHEVLASHFPEGDPTAENKRTLALRARRIIAVSAHTKADLVRVLRVDPSRVDVVHHGFSLPPPGVAADPGPLPERFVLFTGARAGYKNWAAFLRAVAPLLRDHAGLFLVCTGPPLSAEERAGLAQLRIDDRVRHVRADARTLPAIYARAAAFAFPSLYEGFGFPVLEAFAAGCPAALANRGSLPEVGGEAAVYFDPEDPESMRAALSRLLSDGALRASLVDRGRARVATFTWERTCTATLETYRRALEEQGP